MYEWINDDDDDYDDDYDGDEIMFDDNDDWDGDEIMYDDDCKWFLILLFQSYLIGNFFPK